MLTQLKYLWRRLIHAPAFITDPHLRRSIRLFSIMCFSAVGLGNIVFVLSHLAIPDIPLIEDPVTRIVVVGDMLFIATYFLGRTENYHSLGAALFVSIFIISTPASIASYPPDYLSLAAYAPIGGLLASLLFSTRGTLVALAASLLALALLPVFVPGVTILNTIHAMSTLMLISIMVITGILIRQRDMRTIEAQARELAQAKHQAESADKLKGIFLGMVSHELRTPLNNIMGYSDQMLMGVTGDLPSPTITAAERIHRNGEQLNRMINDLLMLSRLESGSLAIINRPFSLADLASEITQTFIDAAESKELALRVTLDRTLPEHIVGDRQRIEQIVVNLTSNAIKFTDRGRVVVDIRRISPREWAVGVTDTGIGISEDTAGRVFDRFYQVDSTSRRVYGGAGLGLAIARELAILMGGSITLQTGVDTGSTFTLTLPLTIEEPAPAAASSQ